jgi:hypothetical protein
MDDIPELVRQFRQFAADNFPVVVDADKKTAPVGICEGANSPQQIRFLGFLLFKFESLRFSTLDKVFQILFGGFEL